MSKRLKRLLASELTSRLDGKDSCVVVEMGSMDVLTVTDLRNELREKGISLTVVKNRVADYAFQELGWDGVGGLLTGPSAVAYGEGGALVASKVLADWERKAPKAVLIRGGLLEGKVLDTDEVRQLATIPDKPALYAMLAAAVVAPVGQVATLVNELLAGVARAVSAVAEKQGGGE